jgi:hypothetical protein
MSVSELFASYLESVYPDSGPRGTHLPVTQYRELKNAFYAAVFSAITEISEIAAKLPEDKAEHAITALSTECVAHASEVLNCWLKNQ